MLIRDLSKLAWVTGVNGKEQRSREMRTEGDTKELVRTSPTAPFSSPPLSLHVYACYRLAQSTTCNRDESCIASNINFEVIINQ